MPHLEKGTRVYATPTRMKYPPSLNNQIVEEVLSRMSNGETLLKISKSKGMPKNLYSSIMDFRRRNSEFYERYLKARQAQCMKYFEEVIDLADEPVETIENEHPLATIQRRKLQIDSRKWVVARMAGVHGFTKLSGDASEDVSKLRGAYNQGDIDLENAKKILDIIEQDSKIVKGVEIEAMLNAIKEAVGLNK